MLPAIFGLAGESLNDRERAFFAEAQPIGFILFRRNIRDRPQLRALTDSLRAVVGRQDAPILVDQEGGRVQRLAPPEWPALPAAGRIGQGFADDAGRARRAAWLLGRVIAHDAAETGFDVVCAPDLDLAHPGADAVVIGDRSFSADPGVVAALGRAMAEGLMAGGVFPVIKHVPGHGRATVDSHHRLPVVHGSLDELAASDFRPFRELADVTPFAMTGHLLFADLDPGRPSTLSKRIVDEIIRQHIGFDGVLLSDDIDMKALTGRPGDSAREAIAAGCDAVLQCSGDFATMMQVAKALPALPPVSAARLEAALSRRPSAEPFDRDAGLAELLAISG